MEIPMRVIIVENSSSEIQRFSEFYKSETDVDLVGWADTEAAGLELVKKYYPDVVILDFQLADGDGLQFLVKLKKLDLPFQPYIVVITWTTEQRTIQSLKDHGAGFVQIKSRPGYDEKGPAIILDFLREMRPYFKVGTDGAEAGIKAPVDLELEKRHELKQYMHRIGIASSGLTSLYTIEAIWASYKNKSETGLLDMENVIYPKLEQKFNVSRSAIERGIRARIESVWSKVDPETLSREFTLYTNANSGRPAVKDFISYYVDKLNGE